MTHDSVRHAISLTYEVHGLALPLGVRTHSTRSVTSSQAYFKGVSLKDICVAVGWSSPYTFFEFYSLDIEFTPGSQVCLNIVISRSNSIYSACNIP